MTTQRGRSQSRSLSRPMDADCSGGGGFPTKVIIYYGRRRQPMIYGELGATGLKTSVIGIGSGGPSRLGLAYGHSRANALALVRRGLECGINFFDSAPTYGTESIIGDAVKDCRSKVILSTKAAL